MAGLAGVPFFMEADSLPGGENGRGVNRFKSHIHYIKQDLWQTPFRILIKWRGKK